MAQHHSMDYLTSLIYNQATPQALTAEEVAQEIEVAKSKKVLKRQKYTYEKQG